MTWAFLLESAVEAAKQSKGGSGDKGAVSQTTARHSQGTADSEAVNAVTANNATATATMVEDGPDNEDTVSTLSAIPLDAEESHILGEVIENRLLSAGLSCEDVRAWKSEALLRDEARARGRI